MILALAMTATASFAVVVKVGQERFLQELREDPMELTLFLIVAFVPSLSAFLVDYLKRKKTS